MPFWLDSGLTPGPDPAGGSGSEKSKIEDALKHGVIKMNIDTDIQVPNPIQFCFSPTQICLLMTPIPI